MDTEVHRLVVEIIDLDHVGADEIEDILENQRYPNHCMSPKVRSIETANAGEWHDDHPLNKGDTHDGYMALLFGDEGMPYKRSNWTTDEVIDIVSGQCMVRGDGSPPDDPYTQAYNDGVRAAAEAFCDFKRPTDEMGAMAYDTRTKSVVHIGALPPGVEPIKVESRKNHEHPPDKPVD